MAKSVLSDKRFHDEGAAYAYLESKIWPDGPVCPHCGGFDRISRMGGKATRVGLLKCYQCRKQFRVTVGTVFESSHVPLNIWLQAVALLTSSKKGISSNQLHRTLGVTLKTAWFMSHRIREAMKDGSFGSMMGGGGGIVEVDETFIGRLEGQPKQRRGGTTTFKNTVFALVERGGSSRVFHVEGTTSGELLPIIRANVSPDARLMTDEGRWYQGAGKDFASHETVNHRRKEYVRGLVHTNTVEGYFSVFKRGMTGVYQHCSEKHLHRYLAEFNFRYSNRARVGVDDAMRADLTLKGIVGKRLKYRPSAN
jgi:transposase-like protein